MDPDTSTSEGSADKSGKKTLRIGLAYVAYLDDVGASGGVLACVWLGGIIGASDRKYQLTVSLWISVEEKQLKDC